MRFLLLVLSLFSFNVFSQSTIETQIHDVDLGGVNDEPLIFLTTGQVVTLQNKNLLKNFRDAARNKTWHEVVIDNDRNVLSIKEINAPVQGALKTINFFQEESFSPSILKDMNQARNYFYEQRQDHHKDSQCYNRAHVWSYEWRTKHNFYSSKAWLFFTRKFIRKYKFEWWFHVAPMVHVVVNNEVKERVMDAKYARGPAPLKQWTDIFMRDGAHCPVVEKYSDHANYPESGSCFVMKSSMYYYQPIDLEMKELTDFTKFRWLETEVKHAYEEAFKIKL